jgi:hypothetical protein
MKIFAIILILLIYRMPVVLGQTVPQRTDTLKRLLMETRQDTSRVLLMAQLSINYRFFKPDSSMFFAQQALKLARQLNYSKGKARALYTYGEASRLGEIYHRH